MIYTTFQDKKLSLLGFGAMRLPVNADGSKNEEELAQSAWGVNGGYYQFSYDGLTAKEMSDEITVEIYDSEGKAVSELRKESARSYAKKLFDSANTAELKTLAVDILNYGAAAQEFFGYNTEDLANSQLSEEEKGYATKATTYENSQYKSENVYGTNLNLENRISMVMYFENVNTDMHAEVKFTNNLGEEKTINVPGSEFVANGSYYQIEVNELVVADDCQSLVCFT